MDANLFAEGSIYYYENRTNSKQDYRNPDLNHDFLVSRPVYVLNANPIPFDTFTINVLTITSSVNRVGIPINVNGFRNGKILPYAFHSVHKEYLARYLGQVSESMKEEIREAVKYHLGYTDECPKYLAEYIQFNQMKEDFINKLNVKEKGVLMTLEKCCLFRDIYYMDFTEFFCQYRKIHKNDGYERQSDVSRCLSKLLQIHPEIQIEDLYHQKIIHGVSLNGRVHRGDSPKEDCGLKGIVSDSTTEEYSVDIDSLSREELINALNEKQRKSYENMDIVIKLQNYKKNPDKLSVDVVDHYNARIIKRLIDMDVEEKKNAVKRRLKKGDSPCNMSHMNQFVIYHLTDDEIKECVNPRFMKKGVPHLRNSIRQQTSYLFRRAK
jgi:mRNA-degrading endonuclease toxin of MazEF toxin-antitoxin module